MTQFRVDKFSGASLSTLDYSTKKPFTPDMDLRTIGYWDATRADKQTVVIGTGGIPKLTRLAAVVGPTLTTVTTGASPASQDAAGNKGIAWRSDSAAEGVQRMVFPAGFMADAKEAVIGFVLSQQNAVSIGGSRLLEFSKDGTAGGVTFSFDWATYGAPNNYVLRTSAPANGVAGYQLAQNFPIGSKVCVLVHMVGGLFKVRMNGVEVASGAYSKADALLPLGGMGVLGAPYDGTVFGLQPASNTLLTHLLFASTGAIPSVGAGVVDRERDRNAAQYWEASLMWAAGLQGSLPADHPFKASAPVTTWMGDRT